MERKAGSDYEQFVAKTNNIPAVKNYINSPEVIVHDIVLARKMEIAEDIIRQTVKAKTEELGSDYARFVAKTNQISDVSEHLYSFSTIVGDLVLSRRIALRLTQKELADKAGTTQARISQIEAGSPGTKLETLNKVFFHLGLTEIDPIYREDAATSEKKLVGSF